MVLTTSHTAASRVLAVLTDAAVTGGHVAALFAVLVQLRAGKHRDSTVSTHTLTPSRVSRLETRDERRLSPRARARAEKNPKPIASSRASRLATTVTPSFARAHRRRNDRKHPSRRFHPPSTPSARSRASTVSSPTVHTGVSHARSVSRAPTPRLVPRSRPRGRASTSASARAFPHRFPLAHRSHRGRARTLVGILRVAERRIERRAVALEAVEATGPDRWTHGRVAVR